MVAINWSLNALYVSCALLFSLASSSNLNLSVVDDLMLVNLSYVIGSITQDDSVFTLLRVVVFNRWVATHQWVARAFQVGREAVVTRKINYDHL